MSIVLKADGISINGQPVILLSSSLFYFRVPRGSWASRMAAIRQAGYNTIDVYFPWNYHELSEGKWNFHGERDIAEFLHLSQEAGLWVVARPGPYICSEWDGGGLPAYLFTKPGLRIRDNDPRYLRYVEGWFDRILPILSSFQIDRGGNIIALQLENELDFYDCRDRAGYMQALRDMAVEREIRVPLIACAGQGDLRGATGNASGLVPTFNIYHPDFDPGVEARAFHFYEQLHIHGQPLCVTETNRSHFFLRRLLSAGAKMVGPYLQAGGVNPGFTQAVNNWGSPLSFTTTDYDFGGMIASDGTPRPEYEEARLFARSLGAYGDALALARASRLEAGTLEGDLTPVEGGPYALDLNGGGRLVALPNVTASPQAAWLRLDHLTLPCRSQMIIASGRCPLLPLDMPLERWGLSGRLAYATAELALAQPFEQGVALAFYAEGAGEIALALPEGVQATAEGMQVEPVGEQLILTYTAGPAVSARLRYPDGRLLVIHGLDRATAARAAIGADGSIRLSEDPGQPAARPELPVSWHFQALEREPEPLKVNPAPAYDRAPYLEEMGILRGFGWYHAQVTGLGGRPVRGYLLEGGSDVLSLYASGRYLGTLAPGGGTDYLRAPSPAGETPDGPVDLSVRAEIWGHSNFDDPRLPAMRLDSLRGLAGITAVLAERDITANWHINLLDSAENKDLFTARGLNTAGWPLVSFAGWLSTRAPNQVCYRKHITAGMAPIDRWVLNFPGLTRQVEVSVNGSPFRRVTPYDPYLDITRYIGAGQPVELTIYAEQDYHAQLAGRVILLEGKAAQGWAVGGLDEAELWSALDAARDPAAQSVDLPVRVAPGDLALLWADLPAAGGDVLLRCQGRRVKLSLFFNGHLIARLWPEPGERFPRLVGGDPTLACLPGPWWKESNRLLVLVEAIDADEPGEAGPVEVV